MIILNGLEVKIEVFPNNERKIADFKYKESNLIELKYENDLDLITLFFVKKRLDELKVSSKLFMWYMPYSRMDRKIDGSLYTLKYIAEYINSLKFEKIFVLEPHSSVTEKLLNNVDCIYPVIDWLPQILNEINFDINSDCIVFPDKGAKKRYDTLLDDYNICVLEKTREPISGRIVDMKLVENNIKKGSKCVIIDDLCSKGGTFSWAASILKNYGASDIYLVVCHCEETVFSGKLLNDGLINKVYTSASLMQKTHPNLKYIEVEADYYVNK